MYINALSFVFLKEEAQISAQFKFGVSAGEIGIGYSRLYQNHTSFGQPDRQKTFSFTTFPA